MKLGYVLAAVLLLSSTVNVSAAEADMQALLNTVKDRVAREQATDQQRLATFRRSSQEQAALLQQAEARLAASQQRQTELKTLFDEQEALLAEQQNLLKNRTGQLGEIFGVVKQQAKDLQGVLMDSLVSAELPGRAERLEFSGQQKVLTRNELEALWQTFQQELIYSGQVKAFEAPVVLTSGETRTAEVIRVGAFNAVTADGEFLVYADDRLKQLARQPDSSVREQAAAFVRGEGDTLLVDPNRGGLLQLLSLKPTLQARIEQGGGVGYLIIGLGIIGLLVALWRLLVSSYTGLRIRRQLAAVQSPREDNPLGRLLLAAQAGGTREDMEVRLDAALLAETPKLEQGLAILKLIAAVAPLLGLLGTVTGMIGTFQSITLFGTGDPKMMAGGISQALITTVLGLCVAIPLLFCHSHLFSRTRRTLQFLQQKSLAILVEREEAQQPEALAEDYPEAANAA